MLTEDLKAHLEQRGKQVNAYKTKKVWFEVLEIIKLDFEEKTKPRPFFKHEKEQYIDLVNNIVNLMIIKGYLNQSKDVFKKWAALNVQMKTFNTTKFKWDAKTQS